MVDSTETNTDVAKKVAKGIGWNFLTFGFSKLGVLLTTAILARLLTKDEFGIVAVAVVAMNYLAIVKDLGLGLALIQRRGDVNEAANTVFTINIIIGIVLSVVTIPLAYPIAQYFNDLRIVPVLRLLGVSFVLNALSSIHMILLVRELDYRRKMIPDMANTIVKGVVSIGMAFSGYGVWSLVVGQLAGSLASVMFVWTILSWKPRLALNPRIAGSLMKFGASISLGDILSVIIDNADYIIVGKIFGLVQLGVYTFAYRLPEMLIIGNLWVLANVAFPAFSSIQDKPDEMRRGFLGSVRVVELITIPIALGMIIAAEPIIRVVFGEQWLDAIPVLRVLAVYAWVYSIGYHIGDVYKAIGRPDILLKLSAFTVIILIPALMIGSRFGMIGVAWGHLFAVLIRRAISLTVASRFTDIKIWDILAQLKPALLASLVMVPVALTALYLTASLGSFLQLIIVVATGAASYIGILWIIERENIFRLARAIGFAR